MDKNINAIEKIITELYFRDYKASMKKLTKTQKNNIRLHFQKETMEAMRIRNDYIADKITEEEYKRWCMEYKYR